MKASARKTIRAIPARAVPALASSLAVICCPTAIGCPAGTAATTSTTAPATAPGGPGASSAPKRLHAAWTPMSRSPLALDSRLTGVWDGRELLVLGVTPFPRYDVVAGAYDPETDTWRELPRPPLRSDREGAWQAVWTGREMIVLGAGSHVAFNPALNRWRQLPGGAGSFYAGGFAMAWTGRLVLAWGGGCCAGADAHGGAYDPARNAWAPLPPGPLAARLTSGVWTGTELVIVGGRTGEGSALRDAAAYNPSSHTWRRLAPMPAPRDDATLTWDGRHVVVIGGSTTSGRLHQTHLAFTPWANRWRELPSGAAAGAGGRWGHRAVWTGRKVVVWGGGIRPFTEATFRPAPSGFAYTPSTGSWTPVPRSPLRGRHGHVVVWTGSSMLVWGGRADRTSLHDGAVYRP